MDNASLAVGRGQPVSQLVATHACVASTLDKTDVRIGHRLCAVIVAFLEASVRQLLQYCCDRPVLVSYGSDGTPLKTRHSISQQLSQHTTIRRSGFSGHELVLQNVFFRSTTVSGEPLVRFLAVPPRPMDDGKTAWHFFQAYSEFMEGLQGTGRRNIWISHFTFDRAIYEATLRKVFQQQALMCEESQEIASPGEVEMRRLCYWIIGTGCCCHDVHNALSWGLRSLLPQGEDSLKEVFAVVEGLRGGYDLLVGHLRQFLHEYVAFVDDSPAPDDLRQLWQAFSIAPEVLSKCN